VVLALRRMLFNLASYAVFRIPVNRTTITLRALPLLAARYWSISVGRIECCGATHRCWAQPHCELFVVAQRPRRHHQRWTRPRCRVPVEILAVSPPATAATLCCGSVGNTSHAPYWIGGPGDVSCSHRHISMAPLKRLGSRDPVTTMTRFPVCDTGTAAGKSYISMLRGVVASKKSVWWG
jgi:hypothetical protein